MITSMLLQNAKKQLIYIEKQKVWRKKDSVDTTERAIAALEACRVDSQRISC